MSVKVTVVHDPGPLYAHADTALKAAADETAKAIAQFVRSDSGAYVAGTKAYRRTRGTKLTYTITNRSRKVPYVNALEFGAWYRGPGKRGATGVHISRTNAPRPLHKLAETDTFTQAYARHFQSTPLGGGGYVATEFGGERGLAGLELGDLSVAGL